MDWCYALENPVKRYAWGSRDVLPDLLGQPNRDGAPWAELWIGAHESDPSRILIGETWQPLRAWIRDHATFALGPEITASYGSELPFLLKVLAVAAPLSLQVHPPEERAAQGYADERASSGRERVFADPRAKPELLVALSRFSALCGFLTPAACRRLWDPLRDELPRAPEDEEPAEILGDLLSRTPEERRVFADVLAKACRRLAQQGDAYALAARLADRYPSDVGIAAPLLLARHDLREGEALFLGPGQIHAYLDGTGVEIMANSDNVLRAGLTEKAVHPKLLLEVLDRGTGGNPIVRQFETSAGWSAYETPVEAFRLERTSLGGRSSATLEPNGGPEILLCVEGKLRIDEVAREFSRGQAVFLAASRPTATLRGQGMVFRARTNAHGTGHSDR